MLFVASHFTLFDLLWRANEFIYWRSRITQSLCTVASRVPWLSALTVCVHTMLSLYIFEFSMLRRQSVRPDVAAELGVKRSILFAYVMWLLVHMILACVR